MYLIYFLIFFFMKFFANLTAHHGWGVLLLRLSVGAVFLYHGVQKWAIWTGAVDTAGMSANMVNLMKLLSIVEPLGGVALIFGFLTQLAALGLAVIMVGAIWFKMQVWQVAFMTNTNTGWEFDLVLLAANLAILFCGAGKLALDTYFGFNKK